MIYFIRIFYLVIFANALLLRKEETELGTFRPATRPLMMKEASRDVPARRSFYHTPRRYTTWRSEREEVTIKEDASLDSASEKLKSTTHRSRRRKSKQTQDRIRTPFTTKYEKGTTKYERDNLMEHWQYRQKTKHTNNRTGSKHIVKENVNRGPRSARRGDYVYTFVNNTINDKGEKYQKIILYNRTHFLVYKGNVVPKDFVHLYKLWVQLQGAKEFNEEFAPPYWMEWHKPPWWMEWHTTTEAMVNDSWDMWNKPGMYPPPPPYMPNADPWKKTFFELTDWFRQLWSGFNSDNVQINALDIIDVNTSIKDKKTVIPLPGQTLQDTLKRQYVQLPVMSAVDTNQWQTGPYGIKDDKQIKSFNKYILNSTLRLFEKVKNRCKEYHSRKNIKRVAKLYEAKFKEFIRTTKHQNIKSNLGAQKVILNAIDTSNRIGTRLINFMMEDIDKRGLLRYSHTPQVLQIKLKKEKETQLKKACSELNLCRSGGMIIPLLVDVMGIMLRSEDIKFKQAFDALTEAFKSTNFARIFDKKAVKSVTRVIETVESAPPLMQRIVVVIIRNIIDRRNAPLSIPQGVNDADKILKTTLAIQDILYIIDEKVPQTLDNVAIWNRIRSDMESWAHAGTPNVQEVMNRLMSNILSSIESLDAESLNVIKQAVNKIVN